MNGGLHLGCLWSNLDRVSRSWPWVGGHIPSVLGPSAGAVPASAPRPSAPWNLSFTLWSRLSRNGSGVGQNPPSIQGPRTGAIPVVATRLVMPGWCFLALGWSIAL